VGNTFLRNLRRLQLFTWILWVIFLQ